jgi:metallophosphoesterase superfamily enzyme
VSASTRPGHPFLARRGDGHVGMGLAGAEVVCLRSGALWLVAERVLVVADLHLEKGSSYARRGQLLPPYDTRETLERLEAVTRAMAPRAVILLGDTFHDAGAEGRLSVDDRARIGVVAGGRALIWVTGTTPVPGLCPGTSWRALSSGACA